MPVYFICISLTTSEVEHLFMHLKTICISFYVSSLFKALAYLFFPLFVPLGLFGFVFSIF